MSPDPAASRRFMANSGDVCNQPRPGTSRLSICASVAANRHKAGVSTSRMPRAWNHSRIRCRSPARSCRISRLAVGRQDGGLEPENTIGIATPADMRSPAKAARPRCAFRAWTRGNAGGREHGLVPSARAPKRPGQRCSSFIGSHPTSLLAPSQTRFGTATPQSGYS